LKSGRTAVRHARTPGATRDGTVVRGVFKF
jgi:hypothetical protein